MTTLPASQKGETDHKIDRLFYELHELMEEEIGIVEATNQA
jgi:hypothetical protein